MSANIKMGKVIRLMNQKGLNGLLIYSRGVSNMLTPSYLQYLAEFRPMGPRNAAVVTKSGEVVLMVDPPWDSFRASSKTWIKDVHGGSDFVKDLVGLLRQLKLSGPVGVVASREMTFDVYTAIKKVVDVQKVDDILEEIAREKTERELEVIRKVREMVGDGQVDLGRRLAVELVPWFEHHASTMDTILASHMEQVGYVPFAGPGPLPEAPEAITG